MDLPLASFFGQCVRDVVPVLDCVAKQQSGFYRAPLELVVGLADGFFGLSRHAYSSGDTMRAGRGYEHRPAPHFARSFEALQVNHSLWLKQLIIDGKSDQIAPAPKIEL